jgi:hypothetical protein
MSPAPTMRVDARPRSRPQLVAVEVLADPRASASRITSSIRAASAEVSAERRPAVASAPTDNDGWLTPDARSLGQRQREEFRALIQRENGCAKQVIAIYALGYGATRTMSCYFREISQSAHS